MKVKPPNKDDIERFGGKIHTCAQHRLSGWSADCNVCGYSFPNWDSLRAYHAFCGFGPTVYDVTSTDRNPIDGNDA